MIVLTDGKLPDEGPAYPEFVRQVRPMGITVSTVMMGDETDISLLKSMAEVGGGSFYQTTDARNLPKIFISDVRVSSGERTLKEEEDFPVREGNGSLSSTTIHAFPPVRGYVETKPRVRANLELVTMTDEKAEPLLASWAYGKGKVIAFTSDATSRWASAWVSWPKYRTFWSELIDSLRSPQGNQEQTKFDLRTSIEHGDLHLDLTVFEDQPPNEIHADLKSPDGSMHPVVFTQLSLGHFSAQFPNPIAGAYEFHAQGGGKKFTPVGFEVAGEDLGEQKGKGFNHAFLSHIAFATGGVANPTSQQLLSKIPASAERRDLDRWLLLLAAILLVFEVLARERMI
jgi:hypothetical protein